MFEDLNFALQIYENDALELTADLWNAICKWDIEHPADQEDLAFHIHAIQNIILARPTYRFFKEHGYETGGRSVLIRKKS